MKLLLGSARLIVGNQKHACSKRRTYNDNKTKNDSFYDKMTSTVSSTNIKPGRPESSNRVYYYSIESI